LPDSFRLANLPSIDDFLFFVTENLPPPAFRIVTPPTRQGAAFQKNGLPDAGPIVDGVVFDVENGSVQGV